MGTVLGAHASRRRPHRKLVWLHAPYYAPRVDGTLDYPKSLPNTTLRGRESTILQAGDLITITTWLYYSCEKFDSFGMCALKLPIHAYQLANEYAVLNNQAIELMPMFDSIC